MGQKEMAKSARDTVLAPGMLLGGRYRVAAVLKVRPRIEVARAIDERTGRPVKIKRLVAGAAGRLMWREGEIMTSLTHPRVPQPLDAFEEGGRKCYVQTYFEGPTLRDLLKDRERLPRAEVVEAMASLLDVLIHLHERPEPVIHRDIKPANVVRQADGEVALIDFGLARAGLVDRQALRIKDITQAHTVGYAPPEQMIGLEALPASDVYAVGASALFLLTGIHPVKLWDAQHACFAVSSELDPGLASWVRWLVAPALRDRCPSAREARMALASIA